MAQDTQVGKVGTQETGVQLQVPGLEQFNQLKFVQSESNPTDLVIQFPDNSEVVIPNYIPLAQAGAAPDMTLQDGTLIPGTQIVDLIDNLDYDKIATAAGNPGAGGQTATGGGAGFVADPSGPLGDDIGHGPYAGGIQLSDAVVFEQLPGIDPDPDPEPIVEDLPFEAIDDLVIHNIQATGLTNPVFIPDVALRHNDIYPRGDWDLVSLQNVGPDSPPESNFEPETATNVTPNDDALGTTEFNGSNSTARFTGQTTIKLSDGTDTGIVGIRNNSGEFYALLDLPSQTTQVDQVERVNWDLARFTLQTEAPGGYRADWDGTRIFLYEGETITMTPHSWKPANANSYTPPIVSLPFAPPGWRPVEPDPTWQGPNYWMAIGTDDSIATGTDPLFATDPFGPRFGWEHLELVETGNVESLTYTAESDGFYYIGIGNIPPEDRSGNPLPNCTPEGMYRTQIEIDGTPFGEFEYTATDNVLSDDARVVVEAREENLYDSGDGGRGMVDNIQGTAGDNIIISSDFNDDLYGLAGDDVLIGRGGDDHLYGGTGRDLFLFENATSDGNDTIFDFNPGEGDIINLDILFDALGVGTREILANETGGNTILTIGDGTGAALAAASGFSITLDGDTGLDLSQLETNGNLVVDES